jgi:hypothetical protein
MRGLRWFTRKPSGYLVEPQNQDRSLGGRRQDPSAPISFDAGGRVAGSQGLHREDAVCGNEQMCYMTYLPPRGCITT